VMGRARSLKEGPIEDPRGFSFGKVFSRDFGTLFGYKPLIFDLSTVGSVHLLRVRKGTVT
jgi:hypothetical protein